jgi:hypothetical protein
VDNKSIASQQATRNSNSQAKKCKIFRHIEHEKEGGKREIGQPYLSIRKTASGVDNGDIKLHH